MITVLNQVFAHGQIYLLLYAYFFVVVVAEVAYENETFSRNMARIGALILVLFIGLRWETGTDWLAYFNIFRTSEYSSDYDITVFGIDSGYLIFNNLISRIFGSYSVFLLIDAFIAVVGVYFFIEKSTKFPNMGVYLFYTSYAITHFMGSNRRMLAIGFVCVGFLHLTRGTSLRRHWPNWALPFGLAAMLHRTAVMALPGLVVGRGAWSAPAVILGLAACVLLGMSGAPFAALHGLGSLLAQFTDIAIVNKLLFYTSGSEEAQSAADFDVMGQALLGVAKRSAILVILVSYMAWGKPSEYAQRLYNVYVVGCAIYFLMIGSPVFQVTSTYYTIVEVALLPIVFSKVPQFKVPYLFYLAIIPFLLMISALSPYLELYVPYRSIFNTY